MFLVQRARDPAATSGVRVGDADVGDERVDVGVERKQGDIWRRSQSVDADPWYMVVTVYHVDLHGRVRRQRITTSAISLQQTAFSALLL